MENSAQTNILFVDDEPEVLNGIRRNLALSDVSWNCHFAESADAAIDVLNSLGTCDIIVSDVKMPGRTGYDLLQHVRRDKHWSFVPFIFLTGHDQLGSLRDALSLGADDYLEKPVNFDDLRQSIEARLARSDDFRRMRNESTEKLKQHLATSLPHEFRTPLLSIIGYCELLLTDESCFSDTERHQFYHSVHSSAKRLHKTLESFIVYAQVCELEANDQMLAREPVKNFGSLLEKQAEEIATQMKRQEDLKSDVDELALFVCAPYVVRAVQELLSNAFKFSESGTPVEFGVHSEGPNCLVTVKDNGRGLSKDQLENVGVFSQFDREKYEQQGLGLGLALASKILKRSGGSLNFQSTPGLGTTAEARIPLGSA